MMAVTLAASGVIAGRPYLAAQGDPLEKAARVRMCCVENGCVEQLTTLNGVVRYEGEYAAGVPVNGVVSAVYVKNGEYVHKGQALFRMDDSLQTSAMCAALSRQMRGDTLPLTALGVELQSVEDAAAWEQQRSVETAADALEALTVRAAADGIVQQVYAVECSGMAAGSPGILLSGDGQEIICKAVQKDAVQMKVGMRARVLYDGQVQAEAIVTDIGHVEAENGQSVCAVKLKPETPIDLPLGAAVKAEVILAQAQDVTVLPAEAVSEANTVRWVAEGRCYETDVTVFMRDETRCWVNLAPGTRVVQSGTAIHGQRVLEVGE